MKGGIFHGDEEINACSDLMKDFLSSHKMWRWKHPNLLRPNVKGCEGF
jgi:hypothetical protein